MKNTMMPALQKPTSSATDTETARRWLSYLRLTSIASITIPILTGIAVGLLINPLFLYPAGLLMFSSFTAFIYVALSVQQLTQGSVLEIAISSLFLPVSLIWMYPRLSKRLRAVINQEKTERYTPTDTTSIALHLWIQFPGKRLLLSFAIVIAMIAFGYIRTFAFSPSVRQSYTQTEAIPTQLFSYPEDSFSIATPGKLGMTSQTASTGEVRNQYYLKSSNGTSYSVWTQILTDTLLSKTQTEAGQRSAIKEALSAYQNRTDGVRIKEMQDTFFQSHPATRIVLQDTEGTFAAGYLFVAYNHFYTLMMSFPSEVSYSNEQAMAYFDSFTAMAP